MSRFLEDCAEYIRTTQPFDIIRLAEIKDGGAIETYEGSCDDRNRTSV